MDLFSLMGLVPEEKTEPTKRLGKKVDKRIDKKDNKKNVFKLPATVIVPYRLPEEVSIEGKDKISEAELCEKYGSFLCWKEIYGCIIGKFRLSATTVKGTVNTAKDVKIGDVVIPNTLTEYDKITEMLADNGFAGCKISYVNDNEYLIPVITSCDNINDECDEEAAERKLFIPGIGSYSMGGTSKTAVLEKIFGKAAAEYNVFDNGTGNLIAALGCDNSSTVAASKKDEYDISSGEVVLSLVWRKFNITPDLFNGSKKVTKDQLCSYLISQGYPEYSSNRTTFDFADEDKKLLMAILKGSSKGAVDASDAYCLEYEEKNGIEYRHEILPWGEFYIPTNNNDALGGYFHMRIPKIPVMLLYDAYVFFKEVFCTYGTEAALQLFWNPQNKRYYWYVPKQTTYIDGVDFNRDASREYTDWLIADFHSHGMFNAFYSAVDDKDEKGTRLYGVIGSLGGKSTFLLRAGCGGFFLPVQYSDAFDVADNQTSLRLSLENVCAVGR